VIAGELGLCSLSWVILTTLMAGAVSSSSLLMEMDIEKGSGEVVVASLTSTYAVSRCVSF